MKRRPSPNAARPASLDRSSHAWWCCWLLAAACSTQELPNADRPQAEPRPASSGLDLTRSVPVAVASTPTATPPEASPAPAAADPNATAPAPAASSATLGAAPEAAAATPTLHDADGKPLPQTDARPSTESRAFQQGGARLFEAIVADDAERALPFFFPVVAYEQVKAIAKPARDWEQRLVSAFKRNIHAYHRRLGAGAAQAQFLRIDVPEARVQWMKPGSEGNRLGYFRVLRSSLVYRDAAGKEASLGVTSLISWRGEWYVVHLDGFE